MCYIFFFNDTATTEIYTLSLHDALPIFEAGARRLDVDHRGVALEAVADLPRRVGQPVLAQEQEGVVAQGLGVRVRSEEHTSELQSRQYLVCRLLLEKKKKILHLLHLHTV